MIIFKKVRWKNLMSYGDHFTEIVIDRSPSTLITGENGSGKSTVCEAISFGLFGKPFRKIRKADLINTKNEKGSLVEVEFENILAGKKELYMVRRGIKPDIFEIFKDGVAVNESSSTRDFQAWLQTNVLKCDHTIFTQIVMIGQVNNVSFMRMKTPDRRAFVETVLNLNIFTSMNKIHSGDLTKLKEDIQKNKTQMTLCQKDISHQKSIIENKKKHISLFEEKEADRVLTETKTLNEEISTLKEKKNALKEKLLTDENDDLKEAKRKCGLVSTYISKAEFKIQDLKKSLNDLSKLNNCSSCGQDVPQDIKAPKIVYFKAEIKKLQDAEKELKIKQDALNEKVDRLEKLYKHNDKINRDISAVDALIRDKKSRLKNITSEDDGKDVYLKEIDDASQKLSKHEALMDTLRQAQNELNTQLSYGSLVKNMLQDAGIKATMIKKFIPVINTCINNNLQKLGFFGKFVLDENFEETIKARGFDKLSYNSYSEGEKLRIDLAVLLAWRDVAKMQGIINTNLLFFDEVLDASMDAAGTQAFASLLNQLKDANVFIISHSPDKIFDSVRSQITFEKDKKGYSKMLTKEKTLL